MALWVSGCSVYTHSVRHDAVPDASRAYVYGRFQMDDHGTGGAMGFVLGCSLGDKYETYNLGFSYTRPLQVFEVLPGGCQIDGTIYTGEIDQIAGQRSAPLGVLRDRDLRPGVGYYIGDFRAVATRTFKYPEIRSGWGITEIKSEYAATTQDMKAEFPNLASLPTEDASKHR